MLRRRNFTPAAGGPIRGLVCRIALATLAVAGSSARAGLIINHVSTRAIASHHPGSVSDDTHSGPLEASSTATNSGEGYSPGSWVHTSSSATAAGAPNAGFLLNVAADYFIDGLDVEGNAQANAIWEDILFLSNNDRDLVGNTLRLGFRARGLVTRGNFDLGGGGSSVGVNLAGSSYDSSTMVTSAAGVSLDGNGLHKFGWDSYGSPEAGFDAWTHIDIPILPGMGGPGTGYLGTGGIYYAINLGASVGGRAGVPPDKGLGLLHASDPFMFVSITLPDVGNVTPESLGVIIRFDSGISSPNLAAVPEPSGLVLCGTGALGLFCFMLLERKTRKTRCQAFLPS